MHHRRHLREPTSRNLYRRILDPKIITCLRGRSESMAINRPTIQCFDGPIAASKTSAGRNTSLNKATLGFGKQIGVRQAGRRGQDSVRRHRSERELLSSDDEDPEFPIKRKRRNPRKEPVSLMSSPAISLGHDTECEECINVRL